MKKITTLLLSALVGMTAWADIPNGFYTNAVGKHDEGLMTALEGIIYTHTKLSYNYLWKAFDNTDMGSDGYYIDMYSTCKYNYDSYHVGSASYVGQGLNREHSFPKSWFGGEVDPMYTDLTMLIPTDGYVNQRRSNNPYGVCSGGITYVNEEMGVSMRGKLGTSTYNGYTSTVFEPDDEFKGDFARIYFYMVTCYKSDVHNWPGCDQLDYSSNNYKAFSNWSIRMLMEWHRADPVSAKEIARNEGVYIEQGNRNPFVDHPELAEYIWGTKQNTPWTGEDIPEDTIVKIVPVMHAVDKTAVMDSSFRADWSRGGDVSSYTLKVTRLTQGEAATLMMSEKFSNVNATADGSSDISSQLDRYTDNPGWTGYKLYTAANQSLKVGTTTTVGYLVSPELELGNTVTVVFNAKNWISSNGTSDASSVIVSCGNARETVTITDSPADYTVVLRDCDASNIRLEMIAAKKRFYIYSVDIYNGDLTAMAPRRVIVEEGDSTWRNVSGITDTCYTVRDLAGGTYEYMVKAVYLDGSESQWSNIELVTLSGDSGDVLLGDVNHDGNVGIADVTLIIDYMLNRLSEIDIEASDVNGDGKITIADVTRIIDIIMGQ